jgi:hypothetical protein
MCSAVEKMEKFMFQMQLTVLIIKFSTKLEKRNAKYFAIFILKGRILKFVEFNLRNEELCIIFHQKNICYVVEKK